MWNSDFIVEELRDFECSAVGLQKFRCPKLPHVRHGRGSIFSLFSVFLVLHFIVMGLSFKTCRDAPFYNLSRCIVLCQLC